MKITANLFKSITIAVRRAAGSRISSADRFDLCQEIALELVEREDKDEDRPGLISSLAHRRVENRLRDDRARREAEPLASAGLPYAGKGRDRDVWFTRDPLANYMAIKASIRGSGENEVEDALIACIDARARRRIGPRRLPTCAQDLLSLRHTLSKRLTTPAHRKAAVETFLKAKAIPGGMYLYRRRVA